MGEWFGTAAGEAFISRRRATPVVLCWQSASGKQRVIARGQRALELFQAGLGETIPATRGSIFLGHAKPDGVIVPLIRRGRSPETAGTEERDDRPYDGPDGSCDRLCS
ncbi:MAG TPA: hypothetical protein VGT61_03500 [Thermomicrobiales bacterium]|nr:hypothetical protein [Thermomicrobiales bacterium]